MAVLISIAAVVQITSGFIIIYDFFKNNSENNYSTWRTNPAPFYFYVMAQFHI
ncbi:MAG: hypothetical protein FWD71_21825 [Oscillospiraceae bacterium]|nr:hypothetical protein [Oscillospiraceae bacterium]